MSIQSALAPTVHIAPKNASTLIATLLIILSLVLAFSLPWLFWLNQKSGFYGLESNFSASGKVPWLDAVLAEAPNHHQYLMFGFLNCTDTCPAQLTTLMALEQELQEHKVRFVYVSIDPARDTDEALTYVGSQLGPNFRMVRPESLAQAQKATNAFRDFAARNAHNEDLQHSGRLYLLSPYRDIRLVYSPQQNDIIRLSEDFRTLTAITRGGK